MASRQHTERERKTIAVVPAAGQAQRMGCAKTLLPFGTTTVIGATVRALRQGGADAVIVVTRGDDRALNRWASENEVSRVENPTPHLGMLSTVQAGVAAALRLAHQPNLLIAPADLPLLQPASVARVLAALHRDNVGLALPTWRGRRGHPLAIAHRWVGEIAHLDPQVGLRQLLTLHADGLVSLPTDDAGVVRDLDTPEDYARLAALAAVEKPS